MTDLEFVHRVKRLADMSNCSIEEKKEFGLLICAACDNEKRTSMVEEFLSKDGITFETLIDFAKSILPEVEIVDDDEDEE